MSEMSVMFVLVGIVLVFVSTLVYINLRSQGVSASRVTWILVELWGTFVVISLIFSLISRFLGPAPAGTLGEEVAIQLSRWRELTAGEQAIVIIGVLVALGLFAHLIWSLRAIQRSRPR